MKIVADDKIPFLRGIFEPYAEVRYMSGTAIGGVDVADADVLIVRTRTRCDAALLAGSRVRVIATATIGYDHIDTDYCARAGIRVITSAGCNARAVAQWVFAAIDALGGEPGQTLGIVGAGAVGSAVQALARRFGFQTLACDPPRAAREGNDGFVFQDELLARADIVTLHPWLDESTVGMASRSFFERMKPGSLFLNSSRGEVVEEPALLAALQNGRLKNAALDVWRNEPAIDPALLNAAAIATPHIAGYSVQGKAMGTALAVRGVARALGIDGFDGWYPAEVPAADRPRVDTWDDFRRELSGRYAIESDDRALRQRPEAFEELRSNYVFRQEFC